MAANSPKLEKPVGSTVVIAYLHPGTHITFGRPFDRFGIPVGVRMSAIRLADQSICIYNPVAPDEPTLAAVKSLGNEVSFIIAPSLVHHVYLDAFAEKFPNATIIGPNGLAEKHKTLHESGRFVELMDPTKMPQVADELKQQGLELAFCPDFIHREILAFMPATRTLLCSDMVFNLPANEQYMNTSEGRPKGIMNSIATGIMSPNSTSTSALGRFLNSHSHKETDRFKQVILQVVQKWQPTVLVPQHGDVIYGDIGNIFKNKFAWAFK